MKWFAFVLALVLCACSGSGQEVKIDVSYKYIYSNQWDNIIRTYNFSRPDLSDEQKLLIHGFSSSVSRIFHQQIASGME